jgi:hypothetical protein
METGDIQAVVLRVIAAAMLIRVIVRLVNGHRLEDVLEMHRWEQLGILACLTLFSAMLAIEDHSVTGWATAAIMAILTTRVVIKQSRRDRAKPSDMAGKSEMLGP